MKRRNTFQTSTLVFVIFSLALTTLFSCKKIKDVEVAPPQNDLVEKFFKIPEDASDELKKLITTIKKQDDKHHFVNQLAGKYGFPRWDKSIANVPIRNIPNSLNTRNTNNDSLQVFLIPFRAADSSVSSYLACARNGDEFTYRYYKKDRLSTLYSYNDTINSLREGLLSVFGYFEKRINNKDSVYFGGTNWKKIRDVTISFNGIPATGRSLVNDPITLLTVCYTKSSGTGPQQRGLIVFPNCITVGVYGSMLDLGFTSSDGYSFGGAGSSSGGGGSTGSNTFPDGFVCPQSEWWCESGNFRFINGILYTPYAYPGIDSGFPWLWWENSTWIYNNLGVEFNQATLFWLMENITRTVEIKNYITTSTSPSLSQRQGIVTQHVNLMMSNPDYLSYVVSHVSNTNPIVWWEDDIWINNPANFNLDLVQLNNPNYELTDAERALTLIFPIQAWFIKENVEPAVTMSNTIMGIVGQHSGHNDKNDAFRHAYFNAINTRDVPPGIGPYLPASDIVRLFAYAHESEVPSQLALEKQMDIFNGEIGINYCWNCFFTSDNTIANAILQKLNNGELRYLKPLDNNDLWWEIGPDGTKHTATNGIILPPNPTPTVLTPTNQ
jgi:hypothetical protein